MLKKNIFGILLLSCACGAGLFASDRAAMAQQKSFLATPAAGPAYADLADFADPAQTVVKAQIRKQAVVEPERSPGLAPGHVRLYIEARTLALLSGSVPVGESLRYLVDVPLDARGKPPKLRKQDVLIAGRTVPSRPGELQLATPTSQLLWTADIEARLRPILAELVAPDAPPRITGIRDALSIAGTLAGESETQIFLSTQTGDPVSITVIRRPNQPPAWGVSWSDIVDQAARPPRADTLEWYRLACFLPPAISAQVMLSTDAVSQARTREDYALVLRGLGPCGRTAR